MGACLPPAFPAHAWLVVIRYYLISCIIVYERSWSRAFLGHSVNVFGDAGTIRPPRIDSWLAENTRPPNDLDVHFATGPYPGSAALD